jgi:predicted phage terminase large subunit-like protein
LPPLTSSSRLRAQVSPEELAYAQDLAAGIAERRARLARRRLARYDTPGQLAAALDQATVQTTALSIIDMEVVRVRDSIRLMLARRERFAELVKADVADDEALQQATDEIPDSGNDRLIVSMPPQEGKSQRVTRYGVLWLLMQFPGLRVGIVSYDSDNATRFSYAIRNDITYFDGTEGNIDLGLRLAKDQKAMSRWQCITGGGVYAIGIGGGLTGKPLDALVIDDPVKDYRAADSTLQSQTAWEWWQTVARPRLAPGAPVIEIATRWHEADLAGRMMGQQDEDEKAGLEHIDRWQVVNIPAEADHHPERGEVDVLGRQPGEFMMSARGRTRAQWNATKAATDPRFWTALYQGKPTPETGDTWLKEWWRRYDTPLWSATGAGSYRIPRVDKTIISVDCSFRDTKSSDYVVLQVWAKQGADSYLIYQVRARLSFTATLDALRRVAKLFPDAHTKIVEAKANGDAVIDSLKKELPGITPSEPTQSKEARARAVSPFIKAGNVHLPTVTAAYVEQELAWDVEFFLVEATAFPNASHDDQVDATSQALAELYLGPGGPATLRVPQGRRRTGARGW